MPRPQTGEEPFYRCFAETNRPLEARRAPDKSPREIRLIDAQVYMSCSRITWCQRTRPSKVDVACRNVTLDSFAHELRPLRLDDGDIAGP